MIATATAKRTEPDETIRSRRMSRADMGLSFAAHRDRLPPRSDNLSVVPIGARGCGVSEAQSIEDLPGTGRMLSGPGCADVLVLGAGFSRSIHPTMPLTDELGDRAVQVAGLSGAPAFEGGSFETWLSRLAEPQPYLSEADNTENRAKFLRLASAIHAVVLERQRVAVASGFPQWLHAFIRAMHYRRSTVVTFNYDLLLETALAETDIRNFDVSYELDGNPVQWFELLGGLPGFPAQPSRLVGALKPTLRLWKLHGSLNWHWLPDDTNGATLNFWDLEPEESDVRRFLPGRVPCIVPPSSLKSAFFRNPVLREIWLAAASALRNAKQVALIGYSMPITDIVAAGMISDTLTGDAIDVTVVNPSSSAVVETVLRSTGIVANSLSSVEEYAARFVEKASRDLASYVGEHAPNAVLSAAIGVGWRRDLMSGVTKVTRHAHGVLLHAGDPTEQFPIGPRGDRPPVVSLRELAAELRPDDTIDVLFASDQRSKIVGLDRFRSEIGAASHWQMLVPADMYRPDGSTTDIHAR